MQGLVHGVMLVAGFAVGVQEGGGQSGHGGGSRRITGKLAIIARFPAGPLLMGPAPPQNHATAPSPHQNAVRIPTIAPSWFMPLAGVVPPPPPLTEYCALALFHR